MDSFKKVPINEFIKNLERAESRSGRINVDPKALEHIKGVGSIQIKNILRIQKVGDASEVLVALQEPITKIATAIGSGAIKIDKEPLSDALLKVPEIPQDKVKNFAEMIIERMQDAFKAYDRDKPIGK